MVWIPVCIYEHTGLYNLLYRLSSQAVRCTCLLSLCLLICSACLFVAMPREKKRTSLPTSFKTRVQYDSAFSLQVVFLGC